MSPLPATLVTGNVDEGQIGAALVSALRKQGRPVIMITRQEAKLQPALQRWGPEVWGLALDLARPESYEQLTTGLETRKDWKVEAVIHAAGGLHYFQDAVDWTYDQYLAEIHANLTTTFLLGQWALQQLPDGSRFVAFSRGGQAPAKMAAYNAAKAGVEALMRTMALEGRSRHLRFNTVAPGLVTTSANLSQMQPASTDRWAAIGDVVRIALWLANVDSAGVTGQVVPVMGYGI